MRLAANPDDKAGKEQRLGQHNRHKRKKGPAKARPSLCCSGEIGSSAAWFSSGASRRLGHITSYRYGWRKKLSGKSFFSKSNIALCGRNLLQKAKKADCIASFRQISGAASNMLARL
jgi:hypothetical protein